jgi:hypothetical protein
MKNLLALLFLISIAACRYDERIHIADVRPIVEAQMRANAEGIDQIEQELKDERIDALTKNVELLHDLRKTHSDMLVLLDTLDKVNNKTAASLTNKFISTRFDKLYEMIKVDDMRLTEETPVSMLRLILVNKESFYINGSSMRYSHRETDQLNFGLFESFIIPDKPIFEKGERVTGRIIVASLPDWSHGNTKRVFGKAEVNGHVITPTDQGCRFEIQPDKAITGEYKLEGTIGEKGAKFTAQSSVFVRGR